MTGLCEGGNEPPSSLKVKSKVDIQYGQKMDEFISTKAGDRTWVRRRRVILPLVERLMLRLSALEMSAEISKKEHLLRTYGERTKEETSEMLCVSVALYGAETWTLRRSEEKRTEAFEILIWRRMELVKWTDRIRNEAVLERMDEERMVLKLIRKRKRNWLSHWLRRNCLLKDALEGMVNRRRVRDRRRYQGKIDEIGAQMERCPYKFLRHLAQETGICESSAGMVTK
ncbi:hypothetical protein ANN_19801 [Periplaneta americana]|uniref:Uncharacterized protein n=1 Tax=Periplaneta americana TaxID=6978 RepID=A0ABQ8SAV1_PERAM|nr:hypothetical protein ANN_19801 [Periplaneta americana]